MDKKLKVRTIIFTEACPLNCRYCDLKNDSNFGESPTMTKEQVFQLVDTFDKQDEIISKNGGVMDVIITFKFQNYY